MNTNLAADRRTRHAIGGQPVVLRTHNPTAMKGNNHYSFILDEDVWKRHFDLSVVRAACRDVQRKYPVLLRAREVRRSKAGNPNTGRIEITASLLAFIIVNKAISEVIDAILTPSIVPDNNTQSLEAA
jgi:hypothetical protein